MDCPICKFFQTSLYKEVDGVNYFECLECKSLFADPLFLDAVDAGIVRNYDEEYWKSEIKSAKERSFGSSISRVAEIFLYARSEIKNFIDIGSGPGYLLDSLAILAPELNHIFHGVELFPPPPEYRTSHANFHISRIQDLRNQFQGGVCIEVIEHLTPTMLRGLLAELAIKSDTNACFYFGSGQPRYVKNEDPEYLDPHHRGHIVSYSVKGVKKIFMEFGFNVIGLPGRDWGFLAEKAAEMTYSNEDILQRIWRPNSKNVTNLKESKFGSFIYAAGVEAAQCYIKNAIIEERTMWALSLDGELQRLRENI